MGCQVCRGKEPEAQINSEDVPKRILVDPSQASLQAEYENFIKNFDSNLHYIGKYISDSDFETLIPDNARKLMTEKTFDISEHSSNLKKNYEIKPVEFLNGCIYQGGWNNNLHMEGYGKFYLKEDKIFAEGIWENGELKYARLFLPNGDIYEGEIKDSKFDGKGKLISLSEGTIYEGDFVEGQKTGRGKTTFDDDTTYEGGMEKGLFSNKGVMKWRNGVVYSGNFSEGALHGNGVLKNSGGESYEGNFDNNLFHGKGKYTFYNGNYYDGDFQWGIKKGKGKYKIINNYSYEGDWDNDEANGYGCIQDGNLVFKSTWRSGKIVETPIFERGKPTESINFENYNFKPEEANLHPKDLLHLAKNDLKSSSYRLGSMPSFLKESLYN